VARLDALGRRPQVDVIVPLEKVKKGFERLAQGPMGKVLVRVAG
jgi:NADPH2:quinone reductase